MTLLRYRRELWRLGKTARDKIVLDRCPRIITKRNARMIARRVVRKERFQRRRRNVSEFVLLDSIPNIENKNAARAKHSPYLRERLRLVGEKHDPELTQHRVKHPLGKRERD